MTHRPWRELFEQLPPEDQAAIKANMAKVIEERRRERGRGGGGAARERNRPSGRHGTPRRGAERLGRDRPLDDGAP